MKRWAWLPARVFRRRAAPSEDSTSAPAASSRSEPRPYSLRRRLVSATVGSTAACWLIGLTLIVSVAWSETSDIYDDALEEGARLVAAFGASMSQRAPSSGEDDALGRETRRVRLYYQVVGENGELLRRSRHVPDQPFVRHVDEHKDFYNTWLDGRAWRVHVLHVPQQDVFVQVAQPWDDRTELLEEMAESLIWPALLLLVLLGIVNWLAIRRLLMPLERMAGDIARKSPNDLSAVASSSQARELQPMVDALNDVLARLAQALQSERRFTADAAHELRTPLAALRMKIQLLQRQHDAAGNPTAAALHTLRADIDRCTALVENLLALARLDPQQPASLVLQPMAAQDWVHETVEQCAPLWRARRQHIHVDIRITSLRGHAGLLRSALRNLLENAVRYGREGGNVSIELTALPAPGPRQGWVMLAVRDDGPGVSKADRARLTQRFFRALGSDLPGSGLGLSIVERIAELHGGHLDFEDGLLASRHHTADGEPGGRGLAVLLRWPGALAAD